MLAIPQGDPIILSDAARDANGGIVFKISRPDFPVRVECVTNLIHWNTLTNLNAFSGSHWPKNAAGPGMKSLFFRARKL